MNRLESLEMSSALTIWQETIDKILSDIPNIVIMFDDIPLRINTVDEHYIIFSKAPSCY